MSKTYYFREAKTGNIYATLCPEYHIHAEQLSQAKGKAEYRQQLRADLLERFAVHNITKVYTSVKHVSSTGMQRGISCYIVQDGEIRCIDYIVQVILNRPEHKKGGTVCNGCGMDMAWDLVYNLSAALYGYEDKKAYTLKQERI